MPPLLSPADQDRGVALYYRSRSVLRICAALELSPESWQRTRQQDAGFADRLAMADEVHALEATVILTELATGSREGNVTAAKELVRLSHQTAAAPPAKPTAPPRSAGDDPRPDDGRPIEAGRTPEQPPPPAAPDDRPPHPASRRPATREPATPPAAPLTAAPLPAEIASPGDPAAAAQPAPGDPRNPGRLGPGPRKLARQEKKRRRQAKSRSG